MGRTGIRISLLASLLVAGCGSVKDSGAIDAAPGDAGPDADESGNVTVSTKGFVAGQMTGVAVPDVDLVSNLPNGTVFATGKTGADGTTTIKVVPGGSVTAVYKRMAPDLGADLATFVGVKVGDMLQFDNRQIPFAGTQTAIGSQTYSWPTAPNAAVTVYRVTTSCTNVGVAAPTLSVAGSEFNSCNKTPMDVLYTAVSNAGVLLNCGTRQNVTFVNGGGVALGGWQNAGTFIGNITGLPATATANVFMQLTAVIDGTNERFISGGGNASGAPSGGAFTGNTQWCNLGERTIAKLDFFRPGNFLGQRVTDSLPSNATSWTVASPVIPPWFEGSFLLSVTQGRLSWVTVPEGTNAADAGFVEMRFTQRINNMNFNDARWSIAMPPDTNGVTLPKFPAALADFAPKAELNTSFNRIYLLEVPTITGYDALRAMGFGPIHCPECAVRTNEFQRVLLSGAP